MNNLVCIKHPKYKGSEGAPVLACKTCCAKYIKEIQRAHQERLDKESRTDLIESRELTNR